MLAHQFAVESPLIEAEMVEATDFPELSQKFNVSSVPHTIINNGENDFVGAYPEAPMLAELLRTFEEKQKE